MQDAIGNVGIIGCGNIAGIYLENLKKLPGMKVVAVADLKPEVAQAKAKEYGVPKVLSVKELLADPEVSIVLNLTIPAAHAEITLAALHSGKHVYGEKPLAVNLADAEAIVKLAASKGLKVASAPDTFLGAGLQTCRAIIDQGLIGKPVAATGFMLCPGHESWHPSPEFYYKRGGGPMLDMGPYYVTALVSLLGAVRRVAGSSSMPRAERLIGSEPLKGTSIKVETPTHLAGLLDFEGGVTATLVTSFDVWHHQHSNIEVYGTEGSLLVPDPNTFGGPVKLRRYDEEQWREMPLTHAWAENSRGLGVADLAAAVREKREARAGSAMAQHVLEVMLAFEGSSDAGHHLHMKTRCERPAAMTPASFGGVPA